MTNVGDTLNTATVTGHGTFRATFRKVTAWNCWQWRVTLDGETLDHGVSTYNGARTSARQTVDYFRNMR